NLSFRPRSADLLVRRSIWSKHPGLLTIITSRFSENGRQKRLRAKDIGREGLDIEIGEEDTSSI
ncbi:MAG TPA: hypothetical protein VHN81_12530, partial [Edaphobacter sp.]|nr:hypothetical protein [Edaphobacter sp.]